MDREKSIKDREEILVRLVVAQVQHSGIGCVSPDSLTELVVVAEAIRYCNIKHQEVFDSAYSEMETAQEKQNAAAEEVLKQVFERVKRGEA